MRISSRVVFLLIGTAGLLAGAPAHALDGSQTPSTDAKAPLKLFSSPRAALQQGMESLRAGNVQSSVEALTYAAANGQPLARWKLGKMYADGDGVPHDDYKAYQYFSKIIESYDEDTADESEASVVSNAYVTVGVYCLSGIPNSKVKPDPSRAREMFQYAALTFGDPNAEYNLARMYLDGTVVEKDGRQAARWLNLAADKNHRQARALLGHLLFTGEGVPRQRARGLMWLTLAREAAEGPQDAWIVDLYTKDSSAASDDDRQAALVFLEDQIKKKN
ncbi:MAG: sel1 repeat family protein [Methylobacteriaceae bacterium]|nr:sel1 repeat family protein [Methylobacteriaceae bacterium]